jgi:prepilin-type N-terminal cleavage/methylation domain-containing protein
MNCRWCKKINKSGGFTLIEVIISLIVAGILSAMFVVFMQSNVMRSYNPVVLAKSSAYLTSIMDNIGADYRGLMVTASDPLATLDSHLSDSSYRSAHYGSNFTVTTKRFDFPTGAGTVTEPSSASASGKLLKVTITYNTLSLVALFSE